MLTYYSTEREARIGTKPRGVLEVLDVREWDGRTPLKRHNNGFEFDTLLNRTYQCSADTIEERDQWIAALTAAIHEADRIVNEENVAAQKELQADSERELQAVKHAAEVVKRAKEDSGRTFVL